MNMTRRQEIILKRVSNAVAVVLAVAAPLVVIVALATQSSGGKIEAQVDDGGAGDSRADVLPANPKIKTLMGAKMSRTQAVRKVEVQPAATPDLATLVRVKGILDFGDPKNNEALVESIRSNQTKAYKVGESLDGINATIALIDTAVTFNYDGKKVRLKVNAESTSSALPVAGSADSAVTTREKSDQQP